MNSNQKELLEQINERVMNNRYIGFDDSIPVPSLDNRIKEFSNGEPIWETYGDEDTDLRNASDVDLANILWEIDRQLEKDEKLYDRCMGY